MAMALSSCVMMLSAPRTPLVPAPPPPEVAVSDNEQFGVEIIEKSPVAIQVNVFRRGEQRTFVWGREVRWAATYEPFFSKRQIHAQIDDAGEHLALFDRFRSTGNGWVFLKKGGDETRVAPETILPQRRVDRAPDKPDEIETLVLGAGSLHFFAEKGLYCFWLGKPGRWFVQDLRTSERVALTEALAQRLDRDGRERALRLVRAHQRGTSVLASLRAKIFAVIPAVGAPPGAPDFNLETRNAYCFLAQYRRAEDRRWLEALLRARDSVRTHGNVNNGESEMQWICEERLFADHLLAIWDGKVPNITEGFSSRPLVREAGFHDEVPKAFLAEVRGKIELPIPFPTGAGEVTLYLIPDHFSTGEWFEESEVIATQSVAGMYFRDRPIDHLESEIDFHLGTILPGRYRCKAVWDRRKPQAAFGQYWFEPSPGDYASVESEAFDLAAGQSLANLRIACTNRIGDAHAYYTADALWKAKAPGLIDENENELAARLSANDTVLFAAPLNQWSLGTNTVSGITLREISIVNHQNDFGPGPTTQLNYVLKVRSSIAAGVAGDHLKSSLPNLILRDEHGCEFGPRYGSSSGRYCTSYFESWPRGAMSLIFRGLGSVEGSQEIAILKLTNAAPVKIADWAAEPLPQRRELRNIAVELTNLGHNFTPEYTFLEPSGVRSSRWFAADTRVEDPLGNRSGILGPGLCRNAAVVRIRSRFLQETNGIFAPEEVLELTIPEMPAAGKYRTLDLVRHIHGVTVSAMAVTGTGEFTYVEGEIADATAKISPPGRPVGPRPPWIPYDENVFVKNGRLMANFIRGTRRAPMVVVSRVPHLAVQFRGLKSGHAWHIEGATPLRQVAESIPTNDQTHFIPLFVEPGTRDVKLRIVVQNNEIAEWTVETPKKSEAEGIPLQTVPF